MTRRRKDELGRRNGRGLSERSVCIVSKADHAPRGSCYILNDAFSKTKAWEKNYLMERT